MCPSCGSHDLKRGEQNLWCNSCGYFPIPFERETYSFQQCVKLAENVPQANIDTMRETLKRMETKE